MHASNSIIYVNSVNGSDVSGHGTSEAFPYQSIYFALTDFMYLSFNQKLSNISLSLQVSSGEYYGEGISLICDNNSILSSLSIYGSGYG